MTVEQWSVLIYSGLLFFMVTFQAIYTAIDKGLAYGFSNRTELIEKNAFNVRIDSTLNNLKEGAIVYLPLVLLGIHLGVSNNWTEIAASMTIISRLVYVPVFLAGIPILRTFVWIPSFLAVPIYLMGCLMFLGQ